MAGNRVAIVQSSYIPWKGYFDLIRSVDHFVLYDDVQFTRRDWRNRNRIKTPRGSAWLTVPVRAKGHYTAPIRDIEVDGFDWVDTHWATIRANYARAPFFKSFGPLVEQLFRTGRFPRLSDVNRHFTEGLCAMLGITTPLSWSWEFDLRPERSERLLGICAQLGANTYLSGPSAAGYLDESLFERAGVRVCYVNYSHYPEYPQMYPPFQHEVSVLDLLLNVGSDALSYMKTF